MSEMDDGTLSRDVAVRLVARDASPVDLPDLEWTGSPTHLRAVEETIRRAWVDEVDVVVVVAGQPAKLKGDMPGSPITRLIRCSGLLAVGKPMNSKSLSSGPGSPAGSDEENFMEPQPGSTASSGSARKSAILRCSRKTALR